MNLSFCLLESYYLCGVDGCQYKAKTPGTVLFSRPIKRWCNDIDVTSYLFGVDGCEYKAKTVCSLERHKAMIHAIDVTNCPYSILTNSFVSSIPQQYTRGWFSPTFYQLLLPVLPGTAVEGLSSDSLLY